MSTNLRSQKQKKDAEEHQFPSLNKNWQRPVALRITFPYSHCPFLLAAITTPSDYNQHTKNMFFGHECHVLVSDSFAHYESRTFIRTKENIEVTSEACAVQLHNFQNDAA